MTRTVCTGSIKPLKIKLCIRRNGIRPVTSRGWSTADFSALSIHSPKRPKHHHRIYTILSEVCGRSDSTEKPTVSRLTVRGSDIRSPDDIANSLNKEFIAFGTPDNPQWTLPPLQDASTAPQLTSIFTTPYAVHKCIKRLKLRKAAGPDGVTHELLKLIGPSISLPLSLLFNLSFSTGIFPTAWKAAVVIPLYKKGAKTDPKN